MKMMKMVMIRERERGTCAGTGVGPEDDAAVVGDANDGGARGDGCFEIGSHGDEGLGVERGERKRERKKNPRERKCRGFFI